MSTIIIITMFFICFSVAFLSLVYAINAVIDVKALQNSTHNIQYVPVEDMPPMAGASEEQMNNSLEEMEEQAYTNMDDALSEAGAIL